MSSCLLIQYYVQRILPSKMPDKPDRIDVESLHYMLSKHPSPSRSPVKCFRQTNGVSHAYPTFIIVIRIQEVPTISELTDLARIASTRSIDPLIQHRSLLAPRDQLFGIQEASPYGND